MNRMLTKLLQTYDLYSSLIRHSFSESDFRTGGKNWNGVCETEGKHGLWQWGHTSACQKLPPQLREATLHSHTGNDTWPSTCEVNKINPRRFCFCRWQDTLVVTGTFKQMKKILADEGFNPSVTKDRLFYLEDNNGYIPMTQDIYNSITEGRLRLWMCTAFILSHCRICDWMCRTFAM